jgi:hypothetical protein
MRVPKAAGLFKPSGVSKAPVAILVLQILSLTGVSAGHCRPRQPGSGGSALAPGASSLASGIDHQAPGSSGGGQAQITITRTITVTSAPATQTASGAPGNKGAMVTVFYNSKDKYPSVGPVNMPSPSPGSEDQPSATSDAGTTGSVSILPISSSDWNKPSSPSSPTYRQSGSGSAQPLPTFYTDPAKSGSANIGDVAHQSPSGAAWSSSGSGTGSEKVTDRLPGGQGGVVVTPTPSSGAWGPNPTLSTSTPGALSYNR